jgi:hypothetical protein
MMYGYNHDDTVLTAAGNTLYDNNIVIVFETGMMIASSDSTG